MRTARLLPFAAGVVFGLLVLGWMVSGLVARAGVDPVRLAKALYGAAGPVPRGLLTSFTWALAAVALFKIAAPALAERLPALAAPERVGSILLSALASAVVLALVVLHVSARAAGIAYFRGLRPVDYAVAVGSLALNAWSLARLVGLFSLRDSSYREYLEFRKQAEGGGGPSGPMKLLPRASIQKKLILSFMTLMLVVILVLATVLMTGFSRTILKAVIDNGISLTDRTASVIKANLGDDIAIADYFAIEAEKNASAGFPFTSLTYYGRKSGTESYRVTQSTSPALLQEELPEHYRGARRAQDLRVLGSSDPVEHARRLRSGRLRPRPDLRALLPHASAGDPRRGALHVRVRVRDLHLRQQHRAPDPVPAHEREPHQRDPRGHDSGPGARVGRSAAL
jgi:hypothetical protein